MENRSNPEELLESSTFILNSLDFPTFLDFKSNISLTLVSKSICELVFHHVSNFLFIKKPKFYKAKRMKIEIDDDYDDYDDDGGDDYLSNITFLSIIGETFCSFRSFPQNLTRLHLHCNGNFFGEPAFGVLPPCLKYLCISSSTFNSPLTPLPSSLITFHLFAERFNHSTEYLPHNLRTLSLFSKQFKQPLFCPKNLVNLYTNRAREMVFPPKLIRLETLVESGFNLNMYKGQYKLPDTVQKLSFKGFNAPINQDLIPNVNYLNLGFEFNYPVENLPNTITHIIFGGYFNQPVDKLPKNLKKLVFYRSDFNHPINSLPQGLIYLKIGDKFNQTIDNLPGSLKVLCLGDDFNMPIDKLPPYLIKLELKPNFKQNNINNLPKSVTHLTFCDSPSPKILRRKARYHIPFKAP